MDEIDRRARFESLYAEHASAVARYAQRRSDAQTAADVVGEVFLVAWRRLEDLPEDVLPWLLACARRVLWHQQRSERRRSRLLDRLATATPRTVAAHELRNWGLAEALATLSERDREALLLTAWEGLTVAQAAQVLGCSAPAFRVRAHRARRKLRAALGEQEGASGIPTTAQVTND